MHVAIKRGLDLPIAGAPEQVISSAAPVRSVALMGPDYPGLKATLKVSEGQKVRTGQTLFTDRRHSEVCYTAPGCGVVTAIHSGAGRRLLSVVIRLHGDEEVSFEKIPASVIQTVPVGIIRETLLAAGLWTTIRERPYNKVAAPDAEPGAIFITTMDSNPLAADPMVVIAGREDSFHHGLMAVSRLAKARVYVCTAPESEFDTSRFPDNAVLATFEGPHPSGLPGTHMHYLAPVTPQNTAWHIGYQDVIAIGELLTTGHIMTERIIALGGPGVKRPGLLRTRLGASIPELINTELVDHQKEEDEAAGRLRVISGPILSGRRVIAPFEHLGRYHQQVTVIPDTGAQIDKWRQAWSFTINPFKRWQARLRPSLMTTAIHGIPGGMLPVEAFEQVWGLSVPAVPLLRALMVKDIDTAMLLGCLELDEEDLALCSYICPGKHDYGSYLRATLREIEREGF